MKFSVLGSSSSGNSSFIEVGDAKFLIDIGFSLKKMEEKLNEIGQSLDLIDAIFITHEHIDHVKCMGPLLRKYNIPIYIHRKSFEVIENKIGKYDINKIKFLDERDIIIKNSYITNFDLTHDSAHCLGYTFSERNKKLVYITDAGYVSKIMEINALNADIIAIESNYDLDLLMMGKYPWDIKNRIKSKMGHLSNKDTINFLKKVISDKLKKIYLLHLSEENNIPAIVKEGIESEFENLKIRICDDKVTKIFEI